MDFPVQHDLGIYRGDPYEDQIELVLDGEPVPVTAGAAQFRPEPDSPDTDAVAFAVDVTDGSDGIVVISLTAEQTGVLPPRGGWDLELTVDGLTSTWLWGNVNATRDYTRPVGP